MKISIKKTLGSLILSFMAVSTIAPLLTTVKASNIQNYTVPTETFSYYNYNRTLKVYTGLMTSGYKKEFKIAVKTWNKKLNKKVITTSDTDTKSNIIVYPFDYITHMHMKAPTFVGLTGNTENMVYMVYSKNWNRSNQYIKSAAHITFEHELGHALGIDHINKNNDIMTDVTMNSLHITNNDVKSVFKMRNQKIYPYTNYPTKSNGSILPNIGYSNGVLKSTAFKGYIALTTANADKIIQPKQKKLYDKITKDIKKNRTYKKNEPVISKYSFWKKYKKDIQKYVMNN